MTLQELLEAVRSASDSPGSFAVIGAVARNAWAPPRATTDLDLTVVSDPEVLAALDDALARLGYRIVREQRAEASDALPDIKVFRDEGADVRQVDLLVAKTEFESVVLDRAVLVDIASIEVPVATPEDLIVYKLLADRPRDRDDVLAVIKTMSRTDRQLDIEHIEQWARYWGIEERVSRVRDALG